MDLQLSYLKILCVVVVKENLLKTHILLQILYLLLTILIWLMRYFLGQLITFFKFI